MRAAASRLDYLSKQKFKTVLYCFMTYNPLTIKRSSVLGDIYKQCDAIESIPVYMNDRSGELLGYVREDMGRYADAFTFHLSESVCKQLSANHFEFAFDFDYSDQMSQMINKKRIKLNHILFIEKKPVLFIERKPILNKKAAV